MEKPLSQVKQLRRKFKGLINKKSLKLNKGKEKRTEIESVVNKKIK